MTHTERIKAILEGKSVDRVPTCAWGPHLNLEDRSVNDFSKAVIAYETQHDFDVLKVMQNGLYNTEDYGPVIEPPLNSDDAGFKKTVVPAIKSLEELKNISLKDVHEGAFGREVQSIKAICDHFKGTVPVLPTVFGPSRMFNQLLSYTPFWPKAYEQCFVKEPLFDFIRANEEVYFHAMDVLSEQIILLMNAYLDVGAAGFFYCPGGDRRDFCTDEEYHKYVRPYDERILNAIQGRAWFTMLHVCGNENLRMEEMVTLPGQAINWEDQSPNNPSIAEVRAMTDKVLMGGVDRNSDFYGASREKVKWTLRSKVDRAIREGGNKLIVSVGCESPREITHRFVVWQEVMDDIANGN